MYVEMSTSSDPYPPIEKDLKITRNILEIMYKSGVRVLITTKSDLVARDADILSRMTSAVMITITTLDESIAKKLEPNAPSPIKRLDALRQLSSMGIPVGIRIDPIIMGLNDDPYELEELIGKAKDYGCKHVVTSTYKARPDNFKRMCEAFPDLASLWRNLYFGRGARIHGYIYLPKEIRISLIKRVVNIAKRYGLTYAVCREGLTSREFFNAPSCDGSHLMVLKGIKGREAKTSL